MRIPRLLDCRDFGQREWCWTVGFGFLVVFVDKVVVGDRGSTWVGLLALAFWVGVLGTNIGLWCRIRQMTRQRGVLQPDIERAAGRRR